jgi:excisionase family DNA binding protein
MTQVPLPIVPPYLNQRDAAEFLGVCSRTVRRWIQAGALPTRRIGGREYVNMAAVVDGAGKLLQVDE